MKKRKLLQNPKPYAKRKPSTPPVKLKKKKKKINSCVKGKVGELELVDFLKERGIPARRGQQYEGSSDSPDVIAGGCVSSVHFECKRVQSGNLYNWLDQACRDADFTKVPVVAHRRNGKRWIAILDLRDLITLMEKVYGTSGNA